MTPKASRAFDDMIPRAFQRRARYDFRTYDMGCRNMYDFPSCEKRYTLKCEDVLKAFFFFFLLLLFKCRFVAVVVVVSLKREKKKKKKKEVSVFRNTHAK